MSCFICASKFNWRRKELDCKSCQKAVCKQCLNQKLVIPKFGPKEIPVCIKCFNNSKKSTTSTTNNNAGSELPPSYDEPSQYFGPSMKDLVAPKPQQPKPQPQPDPDAKLRERLNQLKEKPLPPPTEPVTQQEIEDKFKNVTGRSAASSSTGKPNVLTPQPKLTEAEEIRKLLEQTNSEVNIDNAYSEGLQEKLDDMEKRLYKLKGEDPEKMKSNQQPTTYLDSSSEDEDEAINKIINKCTLVPSNNPGEPSSTFSFVNKEEEEEEELPWCCICNADASIRCHDCDDDLYCRRCFKEGHNDYDMKGHANSAYKKKSKR